MTRSMQLPTKIGLGLAAGILVFGYQNCGQFAVDGASLRQLASLGSSPSAGATLVPETDKVDANCPSKPEYDACVIRQNPIAMGNQILSTNATTRRSQLQSQAIYGVKLTSLGSSGRLENATLSVSSLSGSQISTTASNLKSAPGSPGSSAFEQVNMYYWMNRAAEYFDARTSGALPGKNRAIRVIVDDTVTGYEAATNTIRLKMTDASGAVAWSGDIGVHMFGVANAILANPTGWRTLSAANHRTCNAVDKGCCTSATGCASAIRFGVGEYFAASLFPDRPRIGDAIVNTGNPQIIASVARDIASLSGNTTTQVFTDSAGHAQALGLIYASIWWQMRAAAGAQSAEIDRIFLEHLSLIDGNDDFRTALTKAKTVDARLFSGRYSGQFDAQLAARGL